MEETVKQILEDWGYEELSNRLNEEYSNAVIGIITDGSCSYSIAYDSAKLPDNAEVSNEDYVVQLMGEETALKSLGPVLLFGSNGENEYKGAIIGISKGHLIYDYELIADCKMNQYKNSDVDEENKDDVTLYQEAVDDIEFNIIRAMPYYPEGPRVIMFRDYFN